MSSVKVLHLITELSIGGAQSALWRFLKDTDKNLFCSHVACLYNGDGLVAQQILSAGIPVHDLGMTRKYRQDAFWRLYKLLKKVQPSILHTWMFHANIPGRVLGRLTKVPIVISSERTMGQERYLRKWLNRYTERFADRILCVSQQVADFANQTIGLPGEKLAVIRNGIEWNQFQNLPQKNDVRQAFDLPPQGIIIGAIGRPRPVKGYHILLDAFSQLTPTHPNVHLLFVGNGPDRPKLISQTAQYKLTHKVTYLDDQIDIPGLLPALDLLALPSLYEGMPNVVLEAMAAGLPIVATAVGGTPEVVADGETGLLVPPNNPAALAEAILHLIQKPDLRQQMGQAGRQRIAQHFSIHETVKKTEDLYLDLLNQKGLIS